MDFELFGGRRFFLVFCTSVATTVLTWFTKIDASTYSLVTLCICGAYIARNAVQKIQAPNLELNVVADESK